MFSQISAIFFLLLKIFNSFETSQQYFSGFTRISMQQMNFAISTSPPPSSLENIHFINISKQYSDLRIIFCAKFESTSKIFLTRINFEKSTFVDEFQFQKKNSIFYQKFFSQNSMYKILTIRKSNLAPFQKLPSSLSI